MGDRGKSSILSRQPRTTHSGNHLLGYLELVDAAGGSQSIYFGEQCMTVEAMIILLAVKCMQACFVELVES